MLKDRILVWAKTRDQWILKDAAHALGTSEAAVNPRLQELVAEGLIFHVGTDNRSRRHYNIKDTYFVEPVKKRARLFTTAKENREPIKIDIGIMDRFIRGFKPVER